MRVKVLFFGMLRDVAGASEDELSLEEPASIGDVFEHYAARHPRFRELAPSVVASRNRRFSPVSDSVLDGDEIAFLPPVSGGSESVMEICDPAGHHFAITRAPIDTQALARRLARPEDGAVVTFDGIVRNNTRGRATRFLEYDCYQAMALEMIAELGRELAARDGIGRVGIVHRIGRMEIGESSVVIVVTAPHRKPAFEAAFEAINRLKRTVPIWKKEFFEDGEVWVEGEWDPNAPRVVPS